MTDYQPVTAMPYKIKILWGILMQHSSANPILRADLLARMEGLVTFDQKDHDRELRGWKNDLIKHYGKLIGSDSSGGYFVIQSKQDLDVAVQTFEGRAKDMLSTAKTLRDQWAAATGQDGQQVSLF